MTLSIYGVESSRAARVLWLARELGLEVEHLPVSFFDGGTRAPEFLAVNPNGRIPAIDDGGFKLFESLAINLYLAKKHGGPLAPANLIEDALATQWSFWAVTELERRLMAVMANRTVFRQEDRDHGEERVETHMLHRPLSVLERHLTAQAWMMAARFTVADLNVASVMSLARLADFELSAFPRVDRWLAQCLNRPASRWEEQRLPSGLPRPNDWLYR
jgi:glutathione S-transferase